MLSFKPDFSFSSFTLIKKLFSFSLLSAFRLVSSAYLGLLIFLQQSWFQLVIHPVLHFTWCNLHKLIKQGDNITTLMYSFPNTELVHCSISGSNSSFLTCIHVSQETGKADWCSHLFQNFPQFVVIHTVKGFNVVNQAEVDLCRSSFAFSITQQMSEI